MRNSQKRDEARRRVVKKMVSLAKNGIFYGSPREEMEVRGVSVSSGSFYKYLYGLGMKRRGIGRKGQWTIPKSLRGS